jgi:hypothetical protein
VVEPLYDPRRYEWTCPEENCGYVGKFYGEASLQVAKELHIAKHRQERYNKNALTTAPYVRHEDRLMLNEEDRKFLRGLNIKVED